MCLGLHTHTLSLSLSLSLINPQFILSSAALFDWFTLADTSCTQHAESIWVKIRLFPGLPIFCRSREQIHSLALLTNILTCLMLFRATIFGSDIRDDFGMRTEKRHVQIMLEFVSFIHINAKFSNSEQWTYSSYQLKIYDNLCLVSGFSDVFILMNISIDGTYSACTRIGICLHFHVQVTRV
jgi:hypothetical protein